VAKIHEGIIFSNRGKRTLLDKMIILIDSLNIPGNFIFLADAYYASRKIILPLLKKGNHLVSRVRANAVAYYPAPLSEPGKLGRPKIYGKKVKLFSLFTEKDKMIDAPSPVYGEKNVILQYRIIDLLWRPIGITVRFILVDHPTRGKCILMSTNLELSALEVIELYGLRFKIEVSFKQAIHTVGTYLYHFWMARMTPLRRKSGNQYMHRESKEYRQAVRRKVDAYHRFIQTGVVAQGIMVAISTTVPHIVWRSFGSWLRTVRPEKCPSEMVVSTALKNNFPEFLLTGSIAGNLVKFIRQRLDFSRKNCFGQAA